MCVKLFVAVKHSGNLSIDQIYEVARSMRSRQKSMALTFASSVKEVLGTCVSVGCTVDGKNPRDVQADIDNETLVTPEA